MKKLTLAFLLLMAAESIWAASSGTWEFQQDGLKVVVLAKDADYDDKRSYQVVVSDELRTLARLEVNRDGLVTDAWLTDLDNDGLFEIVVATGQLAGADVGAVDVHEWRDFRFASSKPAKLTTTELVGYHGNDQYTIAGGRLQRSYPMFSESDGVRVPNRHAGAFRIPICRGSLGSPQSLMRAFSPKIKTTLQIRVKCHRFCERFVPGSPTIPILGGLKRT